MTSKEAEKKLNVGDQIEVNYPNETSGLPIVQIKRGTVGEINENCFFLWQNEYDGGAGRIRPSTKGFVYSWAYNWNDNFTIKMLKPIKAKKKVEKKTTDDQGEKRCENCNKKLDKEFEKFNGDYYCKSCFEEIFTSCCSCNEIIEKDVAREYAENDYCEDCFNDNFFYCDDCGEPESHNDGYEVGNVRMICTNCYENDYFTCERCGDVLHNDYYTENGYCQNCYGEMEQENNNEQACPDNKRYYKKSRRDLAVGIEIEAEKGNYNEVLYELREKGFGVVEDGSLDETGIEVQIPASNNGETKRLVKIACDSLTDNGYQATRNCGLHVHIEFPSRLKTIQNILTLIYAVEPIFYAINPKSRRENRYCLPLNRDFSLAEIMNTPKGKIDKLFYGKKNKQNPTKKELKYYKKERYNNSRYYGFNLHSLFYRQTLEFRYHAGTLNHDKIMKWVDFIKELLLYVRFNYNKNEVMTLIELPSISAKLKQLNKMLKLKKPTYNYILERYKHFRKTQPYFERHKSTFFHRLANNDFVFNGREQPTHQLYQEHATA